MKKEMKKLGGKLGKCEKYGNDALELMRIVTSAAAKRAGLVVVTERKEAERVKVLREVSQIFPGSIPAGTEGKDKQENS